jgi:hypothetical protein
MARMAGLPSRVVMGFHTGRVQGPNAYQVRSGDAFAWPEVFFADQGWVSFDPTPAAGQNAERPADEQTKEAEKEREAKAQQLDAIENEEAPTAELPPVDPGKEKAPETLSTSARIGIGSGAAVLALAAVPVVLLVLRRRLRRRRLTSGTSCQRVIGAWWELLDALRLARRRSPAHLAVEEVAAVAAEPVPGHADPLPSVAELAAVVNMVAFAPGLADDAHAQAAARVVTSYASELRTRRPRWRRWAWSIDPRPLIWRRKRESAPAPLPTAARPPAAAARSDQDGGFDAVSRDVHTVSDFATASTERAAATTKQ